MKIGGGGGNPYRGVGQSSRSNKSKGTKGTKKSKFAGKAESVSGVSAPEPVEEVDEVDSPIFDAMEAASNKMDEDSLEEATQAVVAAVITQHFGKKGLRDNEMKQITAAVTSSLTGDNEMRNRMESVLRRISNRRK